MTEFIAENIGILDITGGVVAFLFGTWFGTWLVKEQYAPKSEPDPRSVYPEVTEP